MHLQAVIRSQYLAALEMLGRAVERCPDALWHDPADAAPFWRVAYHALFYTHLYVQPAEADFRPWDKHRDPAAQLGEPLAGEPYSREDLLAYLDFCRREVDAQTAQLDPHAASGFYWLPFDKLELQFYTIRHIQHHAGELMERLGSRAGIEIDWVGQAPA